MGLTRIEGFLRTAQLSALIDPLEVDVIRPLLHVPDEAGRRADGILERWASDDSAGLRRAAGLAHPL